MIPIRYLRGVELPSHHFWLDPSIRQSFAFVSHAHYDHIAPHSSIVATPHTARFLQSRLPKPRQEHLLQFGERRTFHDFAITLLPAGHICGSAQAYLETSQGSLLYTGDFKLRHGFCAEPAEWRHAETLIMETTFGRPRYRIPPTIAVLQQIVDFCQETIADHSIPVLLAYSLGKAQEAICALIQAGLTPMLHPAVFKMTEIHRELLPHFPPNYLAFNPQNLPGHVLISPPNASLSLLLANHPKHRSAILSGWAIDPQAIHRYGCDAAFPLTDHADYDDLIRYVELVQPQRVLTLHGFAADFATDLRRRGIDAWALSQPNQLELPF